MRLTSRGWQAVVIGAVVIVTARLIGTTQLHQLGYVLLALPLVSLVIGLGFARGLDFTRRVRSGTKLGVGRPATVELTSRNRSRFGTSFVEGADGLPERTEFELDPVPGGGERSLEVEVLFRRRGIYLLGPGKLSVVDPFELVGFTRFFSERTEVVVYPEVHKLPGRTVFGGASQSGVSGRVGQSGDEFAGLREYRRGDDRRHIHWKSFARTGELYTKETTLNSPKHYTVALDLGRVGLRTPEGPVEDAVSAAASVISTLKDRGLPFRLIHNGEADESREPRPAEFHRDEAFYWREMRNLATVRVRGGETLSERVSREEGNLGNGVFLVSRSRDAGLADEVARLSRAGLAVTVILVASHTYGARPGPVSPTGTRNDGSIKVPEGEFDALVRKLGRLGASVLVVEHPGGVGAMSPAGRTGVRA